MDDPRGAFLLVMRRLLAVAVLLAVAMPSHAHAQRTASGIATPSVLRVVHDPAGTQASSSVALRRDTAVVDTARTNVAAWGALGGAVLGAGLGYGIGQNCTELHNAGPCQRTAIIGGAVIGAVIGYGLGSIVDMGIAHDRARARARAAGK